MSRVLFAHLTLALVFQQGHIQIPFKHLGWSAFAYPVNNFKLLTVYAKKLPFRCLKGF